MISLFFYAQSEWYFGDAMATKSEQPRIAIVHDWLTNLGGAERAVLALKEAFPEADIYTSVYNSSNLPQFKSLKPKTSFLQHWPLATKKHQLYPLLRQLAFESMDFSNYDVVISSSSAEAKGVITPSEVLHIAYIYTPTRYYWVDPDGYLRNPGFGPLNPLVRTILKRQLKRLKHWDFAAAQRADKLIGISDNVVKRIQTYYRRPADMIYPPVDVARFSANPSTDGDYYLVVSRLVPYKHIDVVVEAFNQLDRRLIIAGRGSELARLKKMAGDKIEFITDADDATVTKLYQGARALIFPTEEDFGITPLEAMAAAKPVIALGRGGALETVVDNKTGLFFDRQIPASLVATVKKFEKQTFNQAAIKAQADKFSETNFITQFRDYVAKALDEHTTKR